MARKCPDCGHWNDNELVFCEDCGEPIDPKTRLMMELEGKRDPSSRSKSNNINSDDDYPSSHIHHHDDDDDEYIPSYHEDEKKKFPFGLVIGLAVVAAVVWFLFFR